jgi:hypothetical protein
MFIFPGGATVTSPYVSPYSGDFELSETDDLRWTAGTPSNAKLMTCSMWVKRESTGWHNPCGAANNDGWNFRGDNHKLDVYNGGGVGLTTTATFTSTSDWYHIVVRKDYANGTANDRNKVWVDGTEITSFATRNNPADANIAQWNQDGVVQAIGSYTSSYFDGLIAEVAVCDGQSYSASDFATDGAPIDLSGLTFGNNGYWLDFTGLGTDISGNGNDFTNDGVTQSSTVPPDG